MTQDRQPPGSYTRLVDPGRDQCGFCSISCGELPARLVAESPGAIAFLDIAPLALGHTLVAPRAHAVDLLETDLEDAVAAIQLVKAVVRALVATLDAHGCSVWQTNGAAGGQTVPHTHFHVLPRFTGDRILIAPPGEVESRSDDEELLARVRELIDPEWQVAP